MMDVSPPTSSNTSLKRRRDIRLPSDASTTMKRTVSNISSTSSDIHVVPPPPPPQHSANFRVDREALQSTHYSAMKPTRSFVANGALTVLFGPAVAKDRFRGIVRVKPRPLTQASNSSPFADIKDEDDYDDDEDDDDEHDEDDDSDDDSDDDGPNHRGTYSKEYTKRHPEIKWIHRGQGRYLPVSETQSGNSHTFTRPYRQTTKRTTGSVASSEQTMASMTEDLMQYFDDFRRLKNPDAKENWSPSFKHQFSLIRDLIMKTPRREWPRAIELIGDPGYREVVRKWNQAMDRKYPTNSNAGEQSDSARTRHSRHVKAAVRNIEQRRSSRLTDAPNGSYFEDDDVMDDTESSDTSQLHQADSKKIFTMDDYKEAASYAMDIINGSLVLPNQPQRVKHTSSEVSHELDPDATLRREDFHKYPGMMVHHKGNGWYKPGAAPNGRRGSYVITEDGSTIYADHRQSDVVEDPDQEIIKSLLRNPELYVDRAFKMRHPEYKWLHRGQGRFKPEHSVFGGSTATDTPAGSSERRPNKGEYPSGKGYADSQASDELRRVSSRTKRSSRAFDDLDEYVEVAELFDKDYVDAHPEQQFHHRGQGRYARGTRPKPSQEIEEPEEERLFDSAYVNSRPNETFHHRGQGKWARGLPPPGSSNKMAIRGPGAKDRADTEKTGEENEAGEKPPPIATLLRRTEGPDRWPNLKWVYRGGGKWCRQSKEDAQKLAYAAARTGKPRATLGRARRDGPEAQLHREAIAAESAPYGGSRRVPGYLQRPGKLMRKRSQLSVAQTDELTRSKMSSRAPSPRPPLLPAEQDRITEEDLPSLYKDDWSEDDMDELDEAESIIRKLFRPFVGSDPFLKALTKHDPAIRSLDSLKQLATNAQQALIQLQDEYLELDAIVAKHPMNGKKERKPVKGGRQTVDHAVYEDKKEAMLYDYNFDARKVGFQDPVMQAIQRDEEGRELRRRRRNDPHATAVNYGDGEMTTRRTIKPVSRFDGVVIQPPRKRSRLFAPNNNDDEAEDLTAAPATADDITPSMSPSRAGTPNTSFIAEDLRAASTRRIAGRWKDHVPKRIRELRGDSVGSTRSGSSEAGGSPKPGGTGVGVRKGRPPGSKNLHKRKDAGIKKGPRKPKLPLDALVAAAATAPAGSAMSATAAPAAAAEDGVDNRAKGGNGKKMVIPAIVENPPEDLPPAAAPARPLSLEKAVLQAPSLAAQ